MDASDANHFAFRVARIADGTWTPFRVVTNSNAFIGGKGARLRWMPDGRSVVFGGAAVAGGGVYVQEFDPDRETNETRKSIAMVDSAGGIETLAVSPDGRHLVVSLSEQPSDLVLVEGLAGLGPRRR